MLRGCGAMLLTAVFCAVAAAQTFTISGTVIEHGINRPLKNAVVTVSPVRAIPGGQAGQTALSYRTAEDGRFAFTELPAGKYRLAARRQGFEGELFEQNENYSTAIAAGPGLESANILFPLWAGGTITGTVVDEDNEPVRQAQVLLFSKGVFSGVAQINLQNQRGTGSSGQFRFTHLKPGAYFVAVQAHPWYARNLPKQMQSPAAEQNNAELDVAYPLTYYADTTDPAAASAITLTEGGSSNLQIVLRAVPALHVQVTGVQTKPGMGIGVGATQVGLGGYRSPANAQINIDGTSYEISGMAPGRYVLSLHASDPNTSERDPSGTFDLTADESLDISAFNRGSLTGRITFEGSGPPPPHAAIFLTQAGVRMRSILTISPDGSLRVAGGSSPLPGRYEVTLANAPGFYLKSIEARGARRPTGQIEIPDSGSVQLSLIAATGVTTINGVAMKDDKPFAGAMALLIPKDFARDDFIRRDQSDSDGTFTLPDVPPGRYTLLAIDDGHDLLYQDAAVMKPYLSQGRELTAPLLNSSVVKIEVQGRQQGGALVNQSQ